MPEGLFDDGLDLSSLMAPESAPMAPVPPSKAATPPQGRSRGIGDLLKTAIVPLLLKSGGPGAVAGFLQTQQQIEQRKQQQAQQQFQNQRLTAGDEANEQYRTNVLAGQQEQRKQALMKEAAAAIQNAESPEAVRALLDFYNPQLSGLGMRGGALDSLALQVATPSRLEQKQAQKYIANLEKTYGNDWAQKVGTATFKLPGSDQPITVQQLLAKSGMTMDGLPVKPATDPDLTKSSLDVQAAAALAKGDTETYNRLLRVKKEMGTADDRPLQTPQPGSLPTAVQRRVDTKSRAFEGLPVVKTIQKLAEAVSFADSLDPNTKNPADDQALIYAFAKAMDPDSVVREGEYATVQKYAQSWADTFGFNAQRIFSNTSFLTPQARANMKATVRKRYLAGLNQYTNVRKSYADQINRITGQQDGADYLTDYGSGFPAGTPQTTPSAAGATYQDYLNSRKPK